ncbi:hypothetical protein DUI87_14432 [Hirundo rustica rustica]|uniref:Uncharacterized protein n=1 Tax=Hirundo rustica rustica TaxID=333673 RepID=A0A3M0K4R9_HIRRU|nr:hypothetical protein DUI87_14432 [Hirundo rustica rustica]
MEPSDRSPAAGAAALLAGSSPAADAVGLVPVAGPALPPLPAASVAAAVDAEVFKFSANGDTAGMRPVFDKGTGNYTRAEGQAGFEPLVQEQCQQTGMAALVQTLQLATPQQPFATIVQGVDEPFLCFAGRLTAAVEKQVYRTEPSIDVTVFITTPDLHPTGIISQWNDDWTDPLHILEWVFLPHQPHKTATALFELIARLIIKCRQRCLQLMGADPSKIILLFQREEFDWSYANNVSLQSALKGFSGQITYHLLSHKLLQVAKNTQFSLRPKNSQEPLQGPTVFTDGSGKTGKAIVTWQDGSEWQVLESHEDGSAQLVELRAAVMAFEKFSQEPFSLITDSAYVADIAQRLSCSVLKEVSNPALFDLLKALWCAIQARVHPYYVLHVRSHTNLPGFVAEGNARADKLANPSWVAPQPDVLAQAKTSHGFFHHNVHTLQKQFQLMATEAHEIVESCDDCHALGAPLPAGVNPRGLRALELWQTDVTQVAEFGRLKYEPSVMWASAHTGEKACDVIAHWRQAFAVLGIPSAVKTDDGPAYASQQDSMARVKKCPTAAPSATSSCCHWQTRGSCSSCTSASSWASPWLPSWATACGHQLHTPMFFFLLNLALTDLGSICTTVPKAMHNSLWDTRYISYTGCAAQLFFFLFFISAEYSLLTVMCYDRYVSICKPLHYGTLLGSRACAHMAAAAWASAFLNALMHTANTFSLPLCHGNDLGLFFCEIPHILKLSCSYSNLREFGLLAVSACLALGCFVFIVFSYVQIFRAVLRIPSEQGRHKAFSTCLPHLAVVSLFLSTAMFAYLKPPSISSPSLDLEVSVLYSVVTPALNPLIYSLRNQELKAAVWRLMTGCFQEH